MANVDRIPNHPTRLRRALGGIDSRFVPYTGAVRDVDLNVVNLVTTGLGTFGNLDVDTLNLNGNVISDSTGTISFDNDNLNTSGVVDADGLVIGATAGGTITDILDEDDLVSDSQTVLATQQSIKAYVDITLAGYVPYTGATANVDLGVFDLTTTGSISAGDTWTAIIGDTINSRAGYFTDGIATVTLASGYGAVNARYGVFEAGLAAYSEAGSFRDGVNTVVLADGTYAINVNTEAFTVDNSGYVQSLKYDVGPYGFLGTDTTNLVLSPTAGVLINLTSDILFNNAGGANFGANAITTTSTLQTGGIAGIGRAPIANVGLTVQGGTAHLTRFYQGADYVSGVGGTAFYGYDDLNMNYIVFGIDQYGHARLLFNGGVNKYFSFATSNGDMSFSTGGAAHTVAFQPGGGGDATFFEEAANNKNPVFQVYGYPDGQSKKYGQFQVVAGAAAPKFQISSDTGVVDFTTDMTFTGAGSGFPYGEIYTITGGDTVLDAQDTWYQFLDFDTNGSSNLTTPDDTNDHITITKTGVYFVHYNISGSSQQANDYQMMLKKNNGTVDISCCTTFITTAVAGQINSQGASCIASLTAGDTIELWLQRLDGGAVSKTYTSIAIVLNVHMLGG